MNAGEEVCDIQIQRFEAHEMACRPWSNLPQRFVEPILTRISIQERRPDLDSRQDNAESII